MRRTLVVLMLVAAGLAVPAVGQPAIAAPGALTWSDEFNGAAGSAPDGSKWGYDIGGGGWGNNEQQYYTNSTRNATMDGAGNLVITARRENPSNFQCHYGTCQYTSARLLTSSTFTQTYGRFEARMKLPFGQGIWPAFWMLGTPVNWPASGEIDIMENIGREPSTTHGTVHGPGYSGAGGIGGAYNLPGGQRFSDAFHVFTVDWAPDSITWYVDGNQYFRITPASLNGNQWVFDHPFFLILNLAVGGHWPGYPDASTTFPQTLTIDYVRAYAWNTGGGIPPTAGTVTGPGGKCVDVAGDDTGGNATAVQLWDCQSHAIDQHWTHNADNSLSTLGRCLDVVSGGTANNTKVQLWDCNGTGAQKWVQQTDGSLRNPQSGRCLDSPSGATSNGTRLQIWDCNGTTAQKFSVNGGGTVVGPGSKCVDVAGDDTGGNAAAVQLWDCQSHAVDQHWYRNSNGSLRTLGRCLDVTSGGTANATQVQLWDCNGTGAQVWQPQADGSLRNPQSGRCLDSPSAATTNGTRLQIWDCNGTTAQEFTLS